MKIIPLLIACIVYANIERAQTIDMPIDKIKNLICKKWEETSTLADGVKVDVTANGGTIYLEFKNDFTLLYYSTSNMAPHLGFWEYIPEEKTIKFGVGDKFDRVYSLNKNELKTEVTVAKESPKAFMIFKLAK